MKTLTNSIFIILISIFLFPDNGISQVTYADRAEYHSVDQSIERELLVTISCFACETGRGTLVVHNPLVKSLNYYDRPYYEINWYSSDGRPYDINTIRVGAVCGETFTVTIRDLRNDARGSATIRLKPCQVR